MAETTLYDHRGNPVRRQQLVREAIPPSLTALRSLWGETVASGLTPQKLAALLQAAAEGDANEYLTLAEEMEERDNHYQAVLGTRKMAVAGLDVTVEAAADDKASVALADEVRDIVRDPAFSEMAEDLLDGLGKGYAVSEIEWERSASQWRPQAYTWRDPRLFRFHPENPHEMRIADHSQPEGAPLPPYKFLVHMPRLKVGIPIRGGLARFVAWTYLVKNYTVKDWVAFAEVYGMPLRVGKYGSGATPEEIRTLVRAVANIGSDAAAVIPDSMKIEFEKALAGTGSGDLFDKLGDWCDKQISKAVLGQTMTTDDGSSLSQAQVHNEVRIDLIRADAKRLAATLNRDLVRPFIDLNHGPQAAYPTLAIPVLEPEDLTALSENLAKLVPLGLEVEQSVIRDKLGLPDPEEGAKLLGAPALAEPAPAQAAQDAAQKAAANHAGCPVHGVVNSLAHGLALNREAPRDKLDDLAEEMLADWEEQMEPMLGPLRQLVEGAQSYEEVQTKLATLLGEMDTSALVQKLAEGMFKARGEGG